MGKRTENSATLLAKSSSLTFLNPVEAELNGIVTQPGALRQARRSTTVGKNNSLAIASSGLQRHPTLSNFNHKRHDSMAWAQKSRVFDWSSSFTVQHFGEQDMSEIETFMDKSMQINPESIIALLKAHATEFKSNPVFREIWMKLLSAVTAISLLGHQTAAHAAFRPSRLAEEARLRALEEKEMSLLGQVDYE